MLPIREGIPQTVIPLAALRDNIVPPPVDGNVPIPLQRKEDDNRRNRDATGEARRQDKVVLGPQTKKAVLHVHPAEPGNRHRRPDIRQVIRRPRQRAIEHRDGVDLAQPPNLFEPPLDQPKDDRQDCPQGKADEQRRVLSARAKHLDRANGAPQDGGREEGVDAGAGEVVGGAVGADVGDAVHLEVEHADADERRDDGGDHLRPKGVPRRDLDVVREFEVVGEPDGVGAGDVAEGFEVVHGEL